MRENFLEESFLLKYHLNMSYSDIRSLPLPYRRWFITRLSDEFKKRAEAQKKASDSSNNINEIPMGEMYQQLGLEPGSPSPKAAAPQPSTSQAPASRTLKFNRE